MLAAERSAEAPASPDGANLKLQGQALALTPVASSGWFGDVFISSKSPAHCLLPSIPTRRSSDRIQNLKPPPATICVHSRSFAVKEILKPETGTTARRNTRKESVSMRAIRGQKIPPQYSTHARRRTIS